MSVGRILPSALAGRAPIQPVQPVQPGQLVRAVVLSVAEDGLLTIALPGGSVAARAEVPVRAGAMVDVDVRAAPHTATGQSSLQFVVRAAVDTGRAAATTGIATPAPDAQRAQAVAAAASVAVQSQGGLAPLMADLSQALMSQNPPPALIAAARQLLGRQTSVNRTPTPGGVRQALSQSGLFFEQRLAAPSAPAQPPDLKALLLILKQAAEGWSRTLPAAPNPGAAAEAAATGRAVPVPPPYRGAPMAAQSPALPTLPAAASPQTVARSLIKQAESALARQDLLQIASLPDTPEAPRAEQAARWMFDMPLATPRGPAVAQFEVSRDGAAPGAETAPPVWRARFSIDIEPIGPVHAQLALSDGRIGVTLWAEREDSLAALRSQQAELALALGGPDALAEVAIHPGAPQVVPAAAGRFVDMAS